MGANASKSRVFVIMPFKEEILALYGELKRKFEDKFEFVNAGDLDNQQNILKDIVEGIYTADIVIADLTDLNPNVFYELGLAHTMNKKVIILTQDLHELPFDIKSYRVVQYSLLFYKIPDLIAELAKLLDGALDGSIMYGNPVSDYAPMFYASEASHMESQTSETVLSTVDNDKCTDSEGENGILDYIADISEKSTEMSGEITSLNNEMSEMNDAINAATAEIGRVKSQSGSADAVFVRNVCRKLATHIDGFATKLKSRVSAVSSCWDVIENCFLGLLDSRYARSEENAESIITVLESLKHMQGTMNNTDDKIEGFVDILQGNIGIERRLNKAVLGLVSEFEVYLNMTDRMSSSIDRILIKGNVL